MLERQEDDSVQPVEYVDEKGRVIGMNGARVSQLLAVTQHPLRSSFRVRSEVVLGLSREIM